MDEERKQKVATFRFGVISDFVVSHQLERGEREKLSSRRPNENPMIVPFISPPLKLR